MRYEHGPHVAQPRVNHGLDPVGDRVERVVNVEHGLARGQLHAQVDVLQSSDGDEEGDGRAHGEENPRLELEHGVADERLPGPGGADRVRDRGRRGAAVGAREPFRITLGRTNHLWLNIRDNKHARNDGVLCDTHRL